MNLNDLLPDPAGNQKILIVDDNPQNLQVLGRLLQEKNFEIEFATSGKAALDWIDHQMFDLILLDINMPEMDGFEVCRKIRENESLNRIPVIFLSADSDRESILKGFELGAQDYVTKPFDSRELIVRVKTHISLKESLENLEKLNKTLEEKVKERTLQLSVANQNLEMMNRRLTELDNAKAEFLSLISHEIRTPLNGIILPLELLKDPASPAESRELIGILNSSVKRLENFSLNALLITRLRTRPNDIIKQAINVNWILDEVLMEHQPQLEKKKVSVRKTMGENIGTVPGEIDLLRKCLFNILDNAITFSPAGSHIDIKASCIGDDLFIEVSDHGKGIPQEIIDKEPEPFSRGREYRDKSTGIGLPLARMIMEAHNGSITLSNRPEGGACVTLRLPVL